MRQVGIRALKQNASEVIAEVTNGETIIITDRGRPVAQISPLPNSQVAAQIASGMLVRAKNSKKKLPQPISRKPNTPSLSESLIEMRDKERY